MGQYEVVLDSEIRIMLSVVPFGDKMYIWCDCVTFCK
jgi:hypothetical protein